MLYWLRADSLVEFWIDPVFLAAWPGKWELDLSIAIRIGLIWFGASRFGILHLNSAN